MAKVFICWGLLLLLLSVQVSAQPRFKLDPAKACPTVQDTLGQLLYINVDGFGKGVKGAIHPAYIDLVKMLNIGGVVPAFAKRDIQSMTLATGQLFNTTNLPMFIGGGYFKVKPSVDSGGAFAGQTQWVGYQQDLCGDSLGVDANKQHHLLDAYLFKTLGFNHWLGPRVKNELKPVHQAAQQQFKHLGLFNNALYPWQKTNGSQPFLYTRHYRDSALFNGQLITTSRQWIKSLTDDIEFSGLVMSDGLVNALADNKDQGLFG